MGPRTDAEIVVKWWFVHFHLFWYTVPFSTQRKKPGKKAEQDKLKAEEKRDPAREVADEEVVDLEQDAEEQMEKDGNMQKGQVLWKGFRGTGVLKSGDTGTDEDEIESNGQDVDPYQQEHLGLQLIPSEGNKKRTEAEAKKQPELQDQKNVADGVVKKAFGAKNSEIKPKQGPVEGDRKRKNQKSVEKGIVWLMAFCLKLTMFLNNAL